MKEKFWSDLRRAREEYTQEEFLNALHNLKKLLDKSEIISCDVVYDMLLFFREIQDYGAIVKIFGDLQTVPNLKLTSTPVILNFHAFAI